MSIFNSLSNTFISPPKSVYEESEKEGTPEVLKFDQTIVDRKFYEKKISENSLSTSFYGENLCNLFVFYIPPYYTSNDIYFLFSKCGKILSCTLIIDNATGSSKGYGFVSFSEPKEAKAAIDKLNGFVVKQGDYILDRQ